MNDIDKDNSKQKKDRILSLLEELNSALDLYYESGKASENGSSEY